MTFRCRHEQETNTIANEGRGRGATMSGTWSANIRRRCFERVGGTVECPGGREARQQYPPGAAIFGYMLCKSTWE